MPKTAREDPEQAASERLEEARRKLRELLEEARELPEALHRAEDEGDAEGAARLVGRLHQLPVLIYKARQAVIGLQAEAASVRASRLEEELAAADQEAELATRKRIEAVEAETAARNKVRMLVAQLSEAKREAGRRSENALADLRRQGPDWSLLNRALQRGPDPKETARIRGSLNG